MHVCDYARRLEQLSVSTGNTFKAVAEEVFMKLEREGRAEATLAKQRWLLRFAYPTIGNWRAVLAGIDASVRTRHRI